MTEEVRRVLVDCHEPADVENRIKALGLATERVPLQTGDYVVGSVLIERKTIDDFMTTLGKGRLFDQLYNMKQSGMRSMLIIIGEFPYHYKNVKEPKMLFQRIAQISLISFVSYGIMIKQVRTVNDFVELIHYLWNRNNEQSFAPVSKKKEDIREIKIDILTRVPGVGTKLAHELAEHYKLLEIMHMNEETISNIKINNKRVGIKAKKMVEVFLS